MFAPPPRKRLRVNIQQTQQGRHARPNGTNIYTKIQNQWNSIPSYPMRCSKFIQMCGTGGKKLFSNRGSGLSLNYETWTEFKVAWHLECTVFLHPGISEHACKSICSVSTETHTFQLVEASWTKTSPRPQYLINNPAGVSLSSFWGNLEHKRDVTGKAKLENLNYTCCKPVRCMQSIIPFVYLLVFWFSTGQWDVAHLCFEKMFAQMDSNIWGIFVHQFSSFPKAPVKPRPASSGNFHRSWPKKCEKRTGRSIAIPISMHLRLSGLILIYSSTWIRFCFGRFPCYM